MRITKLLFVQTGTYNDMASRPYYTNLDRETVSQVQEATEGGTNLTASSLAGVAGSILKPKAEPEGLVYIENGWGEPRLRFMMEVEHESSLGAGHTQILCGYTDFLGATYSGAIARDMRMFFNTSLTVRNITEVTPLGRVVRSNVSDASHLIRGPYEPAYGFGGNVAHTMRPEDLFCKMETGMLGGDVMDLRSTFSPGVKKSRYSNGLAPTYMSRVMQAYKNAFDTDDYSASADNILREARGSVREGMVSQDLFLNQLTRNSQLRENGSITYGELLQLDPTVDSRAVVNLIGETHKHELHHSGQTEHWTGSSMETIAATVLSHSVPAIMMDLMLTRVCFMATNETYGGQYEVKVLGAAGFSERVDLSPYLEKLINRITVEVLRDLTRNNNISISLQMDVDVIGETRISISMNGQPAIDYVTPSFCDALTVPVITHDEMTLNTVASDVETLMGEVSSSYQQHNTPSNFGGNNGYNSVV